MRYIRYYAKVAKPIRWKYNDVGKRITHDLLFYGTVH
jgi:hypothetical protein